MLLTVIGSSGSIPGLGNPCSCYLVESGGDAVLLDLGVGSAGAALEAVRLPPGDGGARSDTGRMSRPRLRAVVISHLHRDHADGLASLVYAMGKHAERGTPRPDAVDVVVPDSAAAEGMSSSRGADPWLRFGAATRQQRRFGPLTATQTPVRHHLPCWATRVSDGARSLVYTGDTGPCDDLIEFARGADVLLCEAAYSPPVGRRPDPGRPATHLTPTEAGRLAAEAGVAVLVLTHLRPWADSAAAAATAADAFGGPVVLASAGLRIAV